MISLLFAILFGISLVPGRKPMCLRFAEKVSGGILPEGAEEYCRRLTWAWVLVLCANAAVSAAVAASCSPAWHGLIASALTSAAVICGTFAIEKRIRDRRFSVSFRTSGSTSNPKTVVKTFESLAKEVAFHRERLADVLTHKPLFLSTVEPGHMYGTLWRRMLPAASGCVVDPEVILTPETLIEKMRGAKAVFLVTTPSFLERFAAYADLYDVPGNCVEITTSGALLTPEVSAAAARIFGVVPLEIFGSTETGGVASRRQTVPDCDWTVFDPVHASSDADGRLVVTSPFSFRRRFAMGDVATLAPGGRTFRLHGRADRIVKVAEQRVSLPDMEDEMRKLPEIADVALCPLDGPHGTFLGAVVVPRPPADACAAPRQKRSLALRQRLLEIFPPGTVPKRYRFVHELPRNPQGKILTSALKDILASRVVEPLAENVVRTEDSWSADLTFDPDAAYFQGHFPEVAVLPGVVQLGMAKRFAETFLRRQLELGTVKKMKFSRPILPGERVHLVIKRHAENELSYAYSCNAGICSSGVLCIA